MSRELAFEVGGLCLVGLGLVAVALCLLRVAAELRRSRSFAVDRFWFEEVLLRPNRAGILEAFDALDGAWSGLQAALARRGEGDEAAERLRKTLADRLSELTGAVADPLGVISPSGRAALVGVLSELEANLAPGAVAGARSEDGESPVRRARVAFFAVLHLHHRLCAFVDASSDSRNRQPEADLQRPETASRRSSGWRASPVLLGLAAALSLGTWLLFYPDPDLRLDSDATIVVVGFWLLVVFAGRWLLERVRHEG